MPAEVETMFYTGEVPWHGLGTFVQDAPDAEAAIREAGLDWDVECRSVYTDGPADRFGRVPRVVVPDSRAVVRLSDGKVIAGVGSRFTPVQNRDAFAFVDSVASGPSGSGDVRYETAGSLKEGRVVWMLARLTADAFDVVPGDRVEPYILIANRHDGRGSLTVKLVNTRVVCQNTLTAAQGEAGSQFRVRHLGDVAGKVEQAREVLGLARELLSAERERMAALAAIPFSASVLRVFSNALIVPPEEATARIMERVERERGEIVRLFEEAPGNLLPGVAGTAWAAVNAVTFIASHRQTRRGGAEKLMESALFGAGEDLSHRAVTLALAAA